MPKTRNKARKKQLTNTRRASTTGSAKEAPIPDREVDRPIEMKLRFSLEAAIQLRWFLNRTPNEVGCWGVCEDAAQPLFVTKLAFPEQENSPAFVSFDDMSNLRILSEQTRNGLEPWQVQRIWIHTHPGNSPAPSGTDEHTLDRISAGCPWFVMFIIAKGQQTYCRLRCRYTHPVTSMEVVEDTNLPVVFDSFPRVGITMDDVKGWEDIFRSQCSERKPQGLRRAPANLFPETDEKHIPVRNLGTLMFKDDLVDDEMADLINRLTMPAEPALVPKMPDVLKLMDDMTITDIWELAPESRELLFDICHWEEGHGTY